MRTVLIPTDFSDNARNATEFAVNLFGDNSVKFLLLHTRELSLDLQTREIDKAAKLRNELEKFKDAHPGKEVHLQQETGSLDEVLKDFVRENKIDIMVMGTRGLKDGKGNFWGTRTSKTIEKVSCPVVVVPDGAKFKELNKIIFATDFNIKNEKALDLLVDLAERFDAFLTALHVLPEEGMIGDKAFEGMRQLHERGNRVSSHFIRNNDVTEGVTDFIKDHRTDMLCVMTHSYTFMERVFRKSVTKHLALHSDIPMLVLHDL